MSIEIFTFVSGNINGVDFTASGRGDADTEDGVTRSVLQFTQFPDDFTPLKCKSWKCVNHPLIAKEIDGGRNLYSAETSGYDLVQTIRYPDNQVIYSSSKVRRIEHHNTQIAISRFDGICRGRVDVVKLFPYDEVIIPTTPGVAEFHGERTIEFTGGEQIVISWEGTLYFVDRTVRLPYEQVIHYEPLTETRFTRSELRYDKEIRVSIAPRG